MAQSSYETIFNTILARYHQSLTEYKTTGNSAFKTQVEMDKRWLDSYVRWLQLKSDQQGKSIQSFVSQYQNTNPELVKMQAQIKKVKEEGPKLQDEYETGQEATKEEPPDFTMYYVKVGLILGVTGLIAAVTAF
jgi:hypothetical protein